jgi:intracellular multiplication protein IcmL
MQSSPQASHQHEQSAKALVPKLLQALICLAVANVLLLVTVPLMAYFLAQKKVAAVAITDSGRVVELVTLDKPYVNDARVGAFAEECLRSSFAHDFENYRATMNSAKTCYTSDGARSFETSMSPHLQDISARNLVMTPTLEVTVIARRFMLGGVVHWVTQTPMTLHRRGSRERFNPQKFVVETEIRRVPLDEHPRGIAVSSISLKPI